jgi:GNAT superfamily N-acetyltransferase
MALPLDGWEPPSDLELALPGVVSRLVGNAEDAHALLQIICDVFSVPPGPMMRWTTDNPAFQLYLSCVGDQPASALATLRAGATIGIYHVATQPGFRRRGLASALLVLALRCAQAAGACLATLTATPEARLLYESLGFRVCGYIEQWIPGPELMAQLTYGGRNPYPRGGGWWR